MAEEPNMAEVSNSSPQSKPIILNDTNPERTAEIEHVLEYINNRLDLNTSLDDVRSMLNKKSGSRISVADAICAALRATNKSSCVNAIHAAYIILTRPIKFTESAEENELIYQNEFAHFPMNSRLVIIRTLIETQIIQKFSPDSEFAQVLNFENEIMIQRNNQTKMSGTLY